MTRDEELLKLIHEQYRDDSWTCWPESGVLSLDAPIGSGEDGEIHTLKDYLDERGEIRKRR